jgi:hypothetical protein
LIRKWNNMATESRVAPTVEFRYVNAAPRLVEEVIGEEVPMEDA